MAITDLPLFSMLRVLAENVSNANTPGYRPHDLAPPQFGRRPPPAAFVAAAADYLFQYRQWYERQKMSVRELKEEFKQSEGDPMIKGKIRQLRMARMRKRMIAQVPKALVVIMNPTHYAVALQYDRGMNAPVCLAKGLDATALKIREVAEEHDIPVVENPPLARALYAVVEIDEEIPAEHYKAVAEIIGCHAAEPFSAGFPVEHPGRESDYYRSTRAGQTNGNSGH